ncbi:hypothetical protein [Serinicoccus marinus]|uniref:hypothetical protein n=1 Tax=Serinicoccus marinus TaxID=247333 RepID=UPI002492D615|nr:hypothetical protein [Serinicoccus marinus]
MTAACPVCGVATSGPGGAGLGLLATSAPDYRVGACAACATLDPGRPGLAVRAALRVLGEPEDDPGAAEAFAGAGIDVLDVLHARAHQPRRAAPQASPFAHVDDALRAWLREAYGPGEAGPPGGP